MFLRKNEVVLPRLGATLMRYSLRPHPDSVCSAVTNIEVEVARPRSGTLELAYIVTGEIGDLLMPALAAGGRTDELWQHTCFEAFVREFSGEGYYEFNFAPSTQWAVYRFSRYRSGMRVATEIDRPRIAVAKSPGRYTLQAQLYLDDAPASPPIVGVGAEKRPMWRLGLSAVIEQTSGVQSYWALTHPPGKADFHHSDCFAVEAP
jgi:hypothetical protein